MEQLPIVVQQERPATILTTPFLIILAVLGMTLGLGLLYPASLAGKTFTLLGITMAGGVVGAWNTRSLSRGMFWAAAIASFVAMFIIELFVGRLSLPTIVVAMFGFGCLEGVVVGPAVNLSAQNLGTETVANAFGITAAVMAGCAAVASMTHMTGRVLGPVLFIALLGLLGFALVGMFRGFSARVSKGYAILGVAIFTGYFLFDFARLDHTSENTWSVAARIAIQLYLDFVNLFLHLLMLLGHSRRH